MPKKPDLSVKVRPKDGSYRSVSYTGIDDLLAHINAHRSNAETLQAQNERLKALLLSFVSDCVCTFCTYRRKKHGVEAHPARCIEAWKLLFEDKA